MRIFILSAHPSSRSFNQAIVDRLRSALGDHELLEHDLYREQFDPVLPLTEIQRRYSLDPDVQAHYRDLQQADALIIVHPDWWGQPPGILKGWLDRVLRPGIAYEFEGPEFGRKHPRPLLQGRRGLVFVTSDSEASQVESLFDMIWRERVFSFCGVTPVAVDVFGGLRDATRRTRNGYLQRVEERARQLVAVPIDREGGVP